MQSIIHYVKYSGCQIWCRSICGNKNLLEQDYYSLLYILGGNKDVK